MSPWLIEVGRGTRRPDDLGHIIIDCSGPIDTAQAAFEIVLGSGTVRDANSRDGYGRCQQLYDVYHQWDTCDILCEVLILMRSIVRHGELGRCHRG